MPVSCDHCCAVVEDDQPPLSWTLSVVGGRAQRYCDRCTRTHVRSLEAKLDPEHW